MRQYYHKKYLLTFALLSTLLIACRHDMEVCMDSPALHIYKSEQLVIPDAIALPANHPGGNTRVATFFAEGVQQYKAQQIPNSNPATFEWVFVAPRATLYDATNAKVGSHGAGPYWQVTGAANDSIFGQPFSPPKSAASPDPYSIDWLLLMPRTGKLPTGIFSNVSYIQRIATKGGKAPARLPASANETVDVKYTAIYRFTRKNT